jgi:hypothetical protein
MKNIKNEPRYKRVECRRRIGTEAPRKPQRSLDESQFEFFDSPLIGVEQMLVQ